MSLLNAYSRLKVCSTHWALPLFEKPLSNTLCMEMVRAHKELNLLILFEVSEADSTCFYHAFFSHGYLWHWYCTIVSWVKLHSWHFVVHIFVHLLAQNLSMRRRLHRRSIFPWRRSSSLCLVLKLLYIFFNPVCKIWLALLVYSWHNLWSHLLLPV